MANDLTYLIPEQIRAKLGRCSTAVPVNGAHVFHFLASQHMIIMGCNPRIKHIVPGIMRAAQELDALVAFELTRTEGGIDGGYTGQTPELFVATLLEAAETCKFTRPFLIHADHVTVRSTAAAERKSAQCLVAAQMAAGYTSFALDASFSSLADNIALVTELAEPIVAAGLGLEVELGEVPPVGQDSTITSLEETKEFLSALIQNNIAPQLLAIDNGSKSGNYLDGQMIAIDLEHTAAIYALAKQYGLSGLVQHGITGTPLRLVGKLAEFGIRKGNIGTLWQNVAHAGLPPDLMDAMRQWAKTEGKDLKYATGMFKADIDAIPESNCRQIQEMAYREAREFFIAFHAQGSGSRYFAWAAEHACGS
jgi:fructose-bisphosphate aldolase, class II